ncbi:MAG: FHA domain-containing protein, partial [Alphaproteobacteria bacterium]|nr:FHA domain-containing protein [Alphaproteobacteria bacterium]
MSTHALASQAPRSAVGVSSEHACLSVVHHSDPAMIGRRVFVPEGGEILLGRGADALGDDALRDDRLSRRHVLLSREGRGVVVEDQASRNGTTINGRRAGVAQLRQGDVLGIGRLLLLFHWVPDGHAPQRHPRVAGEGPALARALEQATRLSEGSAPVLIRGEVGTGRRHLAYEVHRASRKGSPYGVLDCANGAEPPWERICRRVGSG